MVDFAADTLEMGESEVVSLDSLSESEWAGLNQAVDELLGGWPLEPLRERQGKLL